MFHEIKNSLYKTSYPSAPCTIDNVNIEGIWSKTLNEEQFIFQNSKHPIFRTLESLKQLSKSYNNHLFFDGTFKSCLNPFYQFIRYLGLTKSSCTAIGSFLDQLTLDLFFS